MLSWYFHRFSVFMLADETLPEDGFFFSETKEKNRRVQKYPDTEHLVRMLNECPSSKFTLVL